MTFRNGWQWATVEGNAELAGPDDPQPWLTDADQLRLLLREVFTAAGGTHDDWDDYDRTMAEQRRTVGARRTHPGVQQRLTLTLLAVILQISDDNRVRTLTLNRPEVLNAFNEALYERDGDRDAGGRRGSRGRGRAADRRRAGVQRRQRPQRDAGAHHRSGTSPTQGSHFPR